MLDYEERKNSMVHKSSKFNIEEQKNTIRKQDYGRNQFQRNMRLWASILKNYKYIINMHFFKWKTELEKSANMFLCSSFELHNWWSQIQEICSLSNVNFI